jgi:hypothetical protein
MKIQDILETPRREPTPKIKPKGRPVFVQFIGNNVLALRWPHDPRWVEIRGSNYWNYDQNDPLHRLIDRITGDISQLMNGNEIPIFSWYPEYPELVSLLRSPI